MKKITTGIVMAVCMSFMCHVTAYADMGEMACQIVEKTQEKAREYYEEKERAELVAARRKQEEAWKKAQEAKRRAEEARMAFRQEVVNFALQFEGNPYVYGGTSLTNGADCSGFVMSVFANFGISLPRVADAQYSTSTQKSMEELETGDLLFYGSGGIGHVALYIGDGKIIHASTAATGIKISDYDYQTPVAVGTYLK